MDTRHVDSTWFEVSHNGRLFGVGLYPRDEHRHRIDTITKACGNAKVVWFITTNQSGDLASRYFPFTGDASGKTIANMINTMLDERSE